LLFGRLLGRIILKERIEIVILSGAISGEREVSLRSGRRARDLLVPFFPTRLLELEDNALPEGLDSRRAVIFPLVHGDFGEDGQLQRLLESGGFVYVGSGVSAMELTIHKTFTKQRVSDGGIPTLPQIEFSARDRDLHVFVEVCQRVGTGELFLKPNDRGSSLQCHPCPDANLWGKALEDVKRGQWIAEAFCRGRDLTVGVLHGTALGVVEIDHGGEFLDYDAKYRAGCSRHLFPAPIGKELTARLRAHGERAFQLCGCRDWARVDFLLREDGEPFFLEINAVPGFTESSLFPDSAVAAGLSPADCLRELVQLALGRHRQRFS
jgi:D-alanine-D-alanine ligase